VKNKIFPPFKSTEVPFIFNEGVDLMADILDTALILKLIEKNGAFYSIDGQKFQGKERACQYLISNPKTASDFKDKIRVAIADVRKGKKQVDLEVVKGEEEGDELDTIANEL
jgi:hypothetical protein